MALTCHPHCGISNLLISLRFVLPILQRIQNTKLSNTKEYNIRLLLSLMSVAQHPRILNCLAYSFVFFYDLLSPYSDLIFGPQGPKDWAP